MLSDFGLIGLFLIVTLMFVIGMATTPLLLKKLGATPNNPNKVKNATYECGVDTIGKSRFQWNFRYYCIAILFVTLDVMAVFLFPWAVSLDSLDGVGSFSGDALSSFIAILVFIFILFVGYIYAWKKRLIQWT